MSSPPGWSRRSDRASVALYGKVYNQGVLEAADFDSLDASGLTELLNRLGGYYCLVISRPDVQWLANDLYGNYRLYTITESDRMVVSDDWQVLTERLSDARGGLSFNGHERYYFERHRYTTGASTYVAGLDKILPGSVLESRSNRLIHALYMKRPITQDRDDRTYQEENFKIVCDSLRCGLDPKLPTLLFFSGGVDSTYLALALRVIGWPFTPLLGRLDPVDESNLVDQYKTDRVARRLGLAPVVIELPVMDNLDMVDQIVRRHPFDKAYFLPLEHLFAWAGRTFGRCNIVNGQSSDSIYCWGASGRTIGCFLQRLLVNDLLLAQPRVLRGMAVRAIEAVYRHRWKLPRTLKVPYRSNDYWAGLLDPQGYLPVIHIDSEHHEYRRYLAAVVEKLVRGLDNDSEALRMYLKMMYLQGPTNVPLVAAARAHGHNLVMPFVDARLVNLRRERQDDRRNLFRPRYVLEEFMRSKLGFDPAIIHQASREAPTASSDATFGDAVRAVYDRWDQCCRELF